MTATTQALIIEIGGMPISVRTDSPAFAAMLEDRYGAFVSPPSGAPLFTLDIDLIPPGPVSDAEDVSVRLESNRWILERGDFHAEWDPTRREGWVRQSPNPYSIDGVLRILHSLLLATEGGFLVHAASAIRNGRAFLFSGVSGAGKTTISRLAPPDAAVLTDEISYVRRANPAYEAFGTPFAGELARIGANLRAPLACVYLLVQGPENRIEPIPPAAAARALLRNILFFAHDQHLVEKVFESAFDFVSRVPVQRLVFTPDARVWELIV
jgi:hypothetical protein